MNTLAVVIAIVVLIVSLRLFKDISLSLLFSVLAIGLILLIHPGDYLKAFTTEILDWNFTKVIITVFTKYH